MELSVEKIRGGYYQKQTVQSDNLLILEDMSKTINGVTLTIKDGVITINGTSTAATNIDFAIKNKLQAGTYRFLAAKVSGSATTNVAFLLMKSSSSSVVSINGSGANTFTLEEDTEVFFRIWTNTNNVISNVVYNCMISSGSDAKDWVQGIPASPSPDYPSEIEKVGSNVNLFDKNNVNKLSGYIDNSGHFQYDTNNKIIYVKCKANTDYVISSKNIRGVAFMNKVPKIGLESTNFKILTTTELTLNSKENTYLACWYYSSNLTLTEQEVLNSIKIEQGTVATPYSPYNQGSVNLSVGNKNLFNVKQTGLTSATNAEITAVLNDDNSIILNGTATNASTIVLDSIIPYLNFVKDKTYSIFQEYISGNATNKLYSHFIFINKNGKTSWGWLNCNAQNSSGLAKRTTLENGYSNKLCLYCVKGTTFTNYTIKLMVAEGDYTLDTILPYVDYQSQTITMPIQQEMLEGDYISDVEHHEWGKTLLTGEENWKEVTTNNLKRFFCEGYVTSINNNSTVNCISNYFKGTSRNKLESSSGDEISVSDKFLNILSKKIGTKEDFKTWLKSKYDAGNPVVVYYKLATPTNLQLTDEQKSALETQLNTYKNVTNINLSDELASVDISYKKDQNTVNNKLQSQINELKELLSTTQTSALLLDNLQKDIESEVG